MSSYYLCPVNWNQITTSGAPMSGGTVSTYLAGTNTPAATYTDNTGNTPQTNPIVLDTRGIPPSPIWMLGGQAMKFVIKDSGGNVVQTINGFTGINDPSALAASSGSSNIGFIQAGTGAVARTAQAKLRDIISVSDYGTFQEALTAAAGKMLYLDAPVTISDGDIVDMSACSDTIVFGGEISGPSVAVQSQPNAYLKLWGTLGSAAVYGSAIAEGTSAFTVANSFAADDFLILSNFPTDGTDAYTEGSPDAFGDRPRIYANTSTSNLRQTRRKEMMVVRAATGSAFTSTSGSVFAYSSTSGLQFQKVAPVSGVLFCGVLFKNVAVNLRYARNISFLGCSGLSAAITGANCYNVRVDFNEFDAQSTDCRVDFFDACRSIRIDGIYKNFNSPSDNGVIKTLGCVDISGKVIVEGSTWNGWMLDTAFTESPSGYTDLPVQNFQLDIVARGCAGQGVVATCDPYAAKARWGQIHYTSDDTGFMVKGGEDIDIFSNVNFADGSGNSAYLYGAVNTSIFGRLAGGIFNSIVTNPRNGAQTQSTSGTSRSGNVVTIAQQPAFISKLTFATISTGGGEDVKITFDTNILDKTGGQSGGNFTATYTGDYSFKVTVLLNNVTGSHTSGVLRIVVDGVSYPVTFNPAGNATATGNVGVNHSADIYMTEGQVAQVYLMVSGGAAGSVQIQGSANPQTYWSGSLLN